MESSVREKPAILQGKFGGCTDLPDEEGTETVLAEDGEIDLEKPRAVCVLRLVSSQSVDA